MAREILTDEQVELEIARLREEGKGAGGGRADAGDAAGYGRGGTGVTKITTAQAAKLMGKSAVFVREGMKRGALPIGSAVQMPGSSKWSFFVSPTMLADYLGVDVQTVMRGCASHE